MDKLRIYQGISHPLGATFDGDGTNFAIVGAQASKVERCLFDPNDPARETAQIPLPEKTDAI